MEASVAGDGFVRMAGQQWRCAIGRAGITAHKEEGDSATPAGLLPLRRVLFRADRGAPPHTSVPTEPIGPTDGWCDDPVDARYNRPVRLPYPGHHEELWRTDALYDVVGVLGWNDAPIHRGQGSAIFLHVARPDYGATEGCVALAVADLRALLASGLSALRIGPAGDRG